MRVRNARCVPWSGTLTRRGTDRLAAAAAGWGESWAVEAGEEIGGNLPSPASLFQVSVQFWMGVFQTWIEQEIRNMPREEARFIIDGLATAIESETATRLVYH